MSDIAANVESIRERIAAAARRVGRSPDEVTLMAVSKTVEPARIEAALRAGVAILGESRVQEAEDKMPRVVGEASWHLVGRLQTNKARLAGGLFDAIHSIDRSALAERASEGTVQADKELDVYVQVDLRDEATDEGRRDAVAALCREVERLPGLQLRGLMALPPFEPDAEAVRPWFVRLRRLRDRLREDGIAGLEGLSMGMTNDFEVAVEEGATIVRVGTAIFGPRPT